MSVFVCQIKFFFESQGVYIGVWVFVSMVVSVIWTRYACRVNTNCVFRAKYQKQHTSVLSEHVCRVGDTRQCVIFGIGSGHAKMCWLNTFMSVSEKY